MKKGREVIGRIISIKRTSTLIVFTLIISSFSFITTLQGQEGSDAKTSMSYQDLLNDIQSCQDSIYRLKGVIIQFDPLKDARFLKSKDSLTIAQRDTILISKLIQLEDVSFKGISGQNSIGFYKFKFEQEVFISLNTSSSFPQFNACVFDQAFQFYGHFIDHQNSAYNKAYITDNQFNGPVTISTSSDYFYISRCVFSPKNRHSPQQAVKWIFYMDNELGVVRMQNCHFEKGIRKDYVALGLLNAYSIKLFDNIFNTNLILQELSIEDLTIRDNQFNSLLDLANLEFGYAKSEIRFGSISKKVAVYNPTDTLWYPNDRKAFSDSIAVERFFAVYRKLSEYFRYRGNRKDYNACYTEMKDFETMFLLHDYEQNPTLSNWFSWRMNQFLGTFSDYGTKPVKAILYAMWVIFYFSILFFFFHNDWDTFTRDKFMDRLKLLGAYFRSEEGIANLYEKTSKPQYKSYEEFYRYMQESEKEIPKAFYWLSKPLYWLSTVRMKFIDKVLRRSEILDGKWLELDKKKRTRTAILGLIWIISYLLLALFMKALNALTLSINAFTTLGFGSIPTRGIPRYAAILEGFIGWFLLTIFSVSLISQLLQ